MRENLRFWDKLCDARVGDGAGHSNMLGERFPSRLGDNRRKRSGLSQTADAEPNNHPEDLSFIAGFVIVFEGFVQSVVSTQYPHCSALNCGTSLAGVKNRYETQPINTKLVMTSCHQWRRKFIGSSRAQHDSAHGGMTKLRLK